MARASVALPLLVLAALAGCETYDEGYRSATPVASSSIPSTSGAIVTVPSAVVTTPGTAVVASPGVAVVPAPGTAVVPASATSFRTGYGVVDSVAQVRIAPPVSASGGSSSPPFTAYRLTLRMDDGTVQTIDEDNRSFMAGDRVQITPDGHVIRM